MDSVIGVDIGTQSTKAVLVARDGTILAQASRTYAPDTPRPNWAEQHADVWHGAVEACLAEVARAASPGSVSDLQELRGELDVHQTTVGELQIPVARSWFLAGHQCTHASNV